MMELKYLQIIDSVRKYPCLWRKDLPEYKNYELTKAAWLKVIQDCDMREVNEAKNLWRKLRDGHRQVMYRKGNNNSKWKYAKQMEFLDPWTSKRNIQNYNEESTTDATEYILSNIDNTPQPNDGNMEKLETLLPGTTNSVNTPQQHNSQQNDGSMKHLVILLPCTTNTTNTINTPQQSDSQQNDGNMEKLETLRPSTANITNCINAPQQHASKENDANMKHLVILLPCTTNGSNTINTLQQPDNQQNDGIMEKLETLRPCTTNRTNSANTPQQHDNQKQDGGMDSHESRNDGIADTPRVKRERVLPPENEQKKGERRSMERDPLNFFPLPKKIKRQNTDNRANVRSPGTALENFFSSMFKTTNNLPEHLQMRIQRRIFNVVMEAREEVLMDPNIHPAAESSTDLVYNVQIDSSEEESSNSN